MNTFQQLFGMGCGCENYDYFTPISVDECMLNPIREITIKPNTCSMSPDFVRRIIANGDATIVFWADDTKTVVKRSADTEYSLYNAFTAALAIKLFSSNSKVHRLIDDKTVIQNRKHGKKVAKSESDGWGCLTARFKLGDRVVLANPDQEDEATKKLFADNNLVVVPKTIDGKVTVLAGHMDGLKRFDIEPERLALYDRT